MRKVLHSFNSNTYLGLRNYTIVRLFLDTGMRLGELSQLQLNELNLDGDYDVWLIKTDSEGLTEVLEAD